MARVGHEQQYGDWKKLAILGSGGFGQVSLWENIENQEKVAIKVCRQQLQDRNLQRWKNEVEIMRSLNHESIVGFREVPKEIQDKFVGNFIALGMEYCEQGDLRKMLSESKNCCGIKEFQVRDFLSNIGSALRFLHDKNIIHRDLKPENIVMKNLGQDKVQFKIIDLGYAKDLSEHSCGTSFVGTLHYLAPEFSTAQPLRYSETVDFWSFGLVAFECITGRRPFYPHLEALQFISNLREKKSDEHICTVGDDNDTRFLSHIPQPHALNPIFAKKLGLWLQKMLMMDASRRGGGSGSGRGLWYENLQEILAEKHIQVYNTHSHKTLTVQASATMSIKNLKEQIFQQTNIPVDVQHFLLRTGEIPNVTKTAVEECWRQPSNAGWQVFLYSSGDNHKVSPKDLPKELEALLRINRMRCKPMKRVLCLAINFVNSECIRCSHSILALMAITRSVQKHFNFFNECAEEIIEKTVDGRKLWDGDGIEEIVRMEEIENVFRSIPLWPVGDNTCPVIKLKKAYYKCVGAAEVFEESLKRDISHYEVQDRHFATTSSSPLSRSNLILVQCVDNVLAYMLLSEATTKGVMDSSSKFIEDEHPSGEALIDEWSRNLMEVENFRTNDLSSIFNELASVNTFNARTKVTYGLKRAEEFSKSVNAFLTESMQQSREKYDEIKKKIRIQMDNERHPSRAEGQDVLSSMKILIQNFVRPITEKVSQYIREAGNRTRTLFVTYQELYTTMMNCRLREKSNHLNGVPNSLLTLQAQRQEKIWEIVGRLKQVEAEAEGMCDIIAKASLPFDLVESDQENTESIQLAGQMDHIVRLFNQVHTELKTHGDLNEIHSLNWDSLLSVTPPDQHPQKSTPSKDSSSPPGELKPHVTPTNCSLQNNKSPTPTTVVKSHAEEREKPVKDITPVPAEVKSPAANHIGSANHNSNNNNSSSGSSIEVSIVAATKK